MLSDRCLQEAGHDRKERVRIEEVVEDPADDERIGRIVRNGHHDVGRERDHRARDKAEGNVFEEPDAEVLQIDDDPLLLRTRTPAFSENAEALREDIAENERENDDADLGEDVFPGEVGKKTVKKIHEPVRGIGNGVGGGSNP